MYRHVEGWGVGVQILGHYGASLWISIGCYESQVLRVTDYRTPPIIHSGDLELCVADFAVDTVVGFLCKNSVWKMCHMCQHFIHMQ